LNDRICPIINKQFLFIDLYMKDFRATVRSLQSLKKNIQIVKT
jgi:hypothetical protein